MGVFFMGVCQSCQENDTCLCLSTKSFHRWHQSTREKRTTQQRSKQTHVYMNDQIIGHLSQIDVMRLWCDGIHFRKLRKPLTSLLVKSRRELIQFHQKSTKLEDINYRKSKLTFSLHVWEKGVGVYLRSASEVR